MSATMHGGSHEAGRVNSRCNTESRRRHWVRYVTINGMLFCLQFAKSGLLFANDLSPISLLSAQLLTIRYGTTEKRKL